MVKRLLGAMLLALLVCATLPATAGAKELRFSINCDPVAETKQVDPLVSPGEPSHHLHQFFGNEGVTEDREPVRVMRRKPTTCDLSKDTGAYWVPVLYDERGREIKPAHVLVYYRHSTNRSGGVNAHPQDAGLISDDTVFLCHTTETFSSFPNCDNSSRPHPDGAGLRVIFKPFQRGGGKWTPHVALNIRYTQQDLRGASFSMGVGPHGDFWNTWRQRAYKALVDRCLDPNGPWAGYTNAEWERRCVKVDDAKFAIGD